jgi:RimJ/RimL family protein N-acetyltransferase
MVAMDGDPIHGAVDVRAPDPPDKMSPICETERSRLREFGHRDLDDLAAMVADEDQMTFYPRPRTRDDASAWIARNLALYEGHGYGFWLVESHPGSGFAGYCGIRPVALEGSPETEIGWHIHKRCWNRGIATEVATAVRDVAFGRFGVSRLVAIIHPDHAASRRVAEKIGMQEERTTVFEGEPTVIYALGRP